jgi:NAD(P)-dependent dehydrogenase (short-subunit alcohol dehydrogenase family)
MERILMSNIFKGKVALITGGSRGLGAATAEAFADHGADVAISYAASADKGQAVVEKLKAKGVRAIAIKSDQADLASGKHLIDSVIAELGKLDILVNNAGIAIQGQMVDDPELDQDKYNRQWQVNVMGSIANSPARLRASAASRQKQTSYCRCMQGLSCRQGSVLQTMPMTNALLQASQLLYVIKSSLALLTCEFWSVGEDRQNDKIPGCWHSKQLSVLAQSQAHRSIRLRLRISRRSVAFN